MATMTELMEQVQALVAERRRQRAAKEAADALHCHLSKQGLRDQLAVMGWPPELVERARIRLDAPYGLFAYVELAMIEYGIRGIDIHFRRMRGDPQTTTWNPERANLYGVASTYCVVTEYECNPFNGEITPKRCEYTDDLAYALALALEANDSWEEAAEEERQAQQETLEEATDQMVPWLEGEE